MSEAGFKATRAEVNEALQVSDGADCTFFVTFDGQLGTEDDLLITVAVKDHVYGITSPGSSRRATSTKLYFTLANGRQTDFVDGAKKTTDAAAKCDLSDFTGDATLTVYKTDPQTVGTYPTGLVQIKQETIHITMGD